MATGKLKAMSMDQQLDILIDELQICDNETGEPPIKQVDRLIVKLQLIAAKIVAEDVLNDLIELQNADKKKCQERICHYVNLWSGSIAGFASTLIDRNIQIPSESKMIH